MTPMRFAVLVMLNLALLLVHSVALAGTEPSFECRSVDVIADGVDAPAARDAFVKALHDELQPKIAVFTPPAPVDGELEVRLTTATSSYHPDQSITLSKGRFCVTAHVTSPDDHVELAKTDAVCSEGTRVDGACGAECKQSAQAAWGAPNALALGKKTAAVVDGVAKSRASGLAFWAPAGGAAQLQIGGRSAVASDRDADASARAIVARGCLANERTVHVARLVNGARTDVGDFVASNDTTPRELPSSGAMEGGKDDGDAGKPDGGPGDGKSNPGGKPNAGGDRQPLWIFVGVAFAAVFAIALAKGQDGVVRVGLCMLLALAAAVLLFGLLDGSSAVAEYPQLKLGGPAALFMAVLLLALKVSPKESASPPPPAPVPTGAVPAPPNPRIDVTVTVLDAARAPVGNASITLLLPRTSVVGHTDANGQAQFPDLPRGENAELRVLAEGHTPKNVSAALTTPDVHVELATTNPADRRSTPFNMTVSLLTADGELVTTGKMLLVLGEETREVGIGPDGKARFVGVPPRYWKTSVRYVVRVPGFRAPQHHLVATDDLELELAAQSAPAVATTDALASVERPTAVLIVGSSPGDLPANDVARQVEAIRKAADVGSKKPVLTTSSETRAGELIGLLLDTRPSIVHLSVNAGEGDKIFLSDPSGRGVAMEAEPLAKLFKAGAESTDLIVLCFSDGAQIAGKLRDCANHIIYMAGHLDDDAALAFSTLLYGALFDGKSLATAFAVAETQLLAHETWRAAAPALLDRAAPDAGGRA